MLPVSIPMIEHNSMNVFETARIHLTRNAVSMAHHVTKTTGVGFELQAEDTVDSLPALTEAWNKSVRERVPFPIYSGHCDRTIYTDAYANQCWRFWHDYLHVMHQAPTTFEGELELAEIQCKLIEDRFGAGSPEAFIAYADSAGQAVYYRQTGKFPDDQYEFVRDVWIEFNGNLNHLKEYISHASRLSA